MKARFNNSKGEWNIRVNDTEFELLAKILYTLNCDSDWSNDCTEVASHMTLSMAEVETLTAMSL